VFGDLRHIALPEDLGLNAGQHCMAVKSIGIDHVFATCKARRVIVELLADAERRRIEEARNASNSPKDDGAYCRYRDMRADGLPIDIDIRVLQAGKLRDGRFFLLVRPLGFSRGRHCPYDRRRARAGAIDCDLCYNPTGWACQGTRN
jgi:hypothetical protein